MQGLPEVWIVGGMRLPKKWVHCTAGMGGGQLTAASWAIDAQNLLCIDPTRSRTIKD
jgi:hypothetical protein